MATESNRGKLEGGENRSPAKKARRSKRTLRARAALCPAGSSPRSERRARSCAVLAGLRSLLLYSLHIRHCCRSRSQE